MAAAVGLAHCHPAHHIDSIFPILGEETAGGHSLPIQKQKQVPGPLLFLVKFCTEALLLQKDFLPDGPGQRGILEPLDNGDFFHNRSPFPLGECFFFYYILLPFG